MTVEYGVDQPVQKTTLVNGRVRLESVGGIALTLTPGVYEELKGEAVRPTGSSRRPSTHTKTL